jgi:hypothetical protein
MNYSASQSSRLNLMMLWQLSFKRSFTVGKRQLVEKIACENAALLVDNHDSL